MARKTNTLRFILTVLVVAFLFVISIIPIRIAVVYSHTPQPQAIFMLSGNIDRVDFTAKFAKKHPNLPIWVSKGSSRVRNGFKEINLNPNRLHYDDRATDTVTNFTTMVEPLQEHDIHHVYLITSDYHMARSRAIATVVFGSQGIVVTPIPVPSNRDPEATIRVARDIGRSLVWLLTGRTGASLKPQLSTILSTNNPDFMSNCYCYFSSDRALL